MRSARIEAAGPAGFRVAGTLEAPHQTSPDRRPAALVVHLDPALEPQVRELALGLLEAGWVVLRLDAPADGSTPPDRAAVQGLEAAIEALSQQDGVDGERMALVGLGRAGTLAYLAGCASRRVAAVVDAGGALVRGEFSAAHPHEPLELALNLGAPLLVLLGAEDPSTPPAQCALIEQALSRAMRSCELERAPGCGARFLDPAAPGYHPRAARAVRERIVRFLRASLELD